MDGIDSTAGIVAVVGAALGATGLLVAVATALRMRRLRSEQRAVLGDQGEEDLVSYAVSTEARVEELRGAIAEIEGALSSRLEAAERRLDGAVSRAAVVRYDAFNESTGRQSSSVALLDDRGDGIVISAILQREQARVYAKPVRGGTSELQLSPEEREAMRVAGESDRG